MRVTLAEQGGSAAAIRLGQPPRALSAADLAPAEAEELKRLVAAAVATPSRPATVPGRGADAVVYTVTVADGGDGHRLEQSDLDKSREFAALVRWLKQHLPAT